ncbi:hypothetical protein KJ785_04060 [Patescibacteria group bacterium]|nr:hypothetical protein [Patescibacteria group bacterium]
MNSLSDILNQKADELFLNDTDTPTEEIKSDDAPTNTPKENNEKNLNIAELKNAIYKIKDQLDSMLRMMDGEIIKTANKQNPDIENLSTGEKIIEGVFNGEKMVGSDGKEYSIPPNYASKSKLVEGDMMKLTITNNGSFIYKQIQPIDRKRITGELISDQTTGQWSVLADGRTYRILTASVTFFKGRSGDEVVLLVPKDGESDWGAVENIISKT